ncbi:ATP-dependent nuclease [Neisseria elongata]|uniref:ATP-dependent nuclease n=1 Tax=Neisseria elongata TaxID=495 RepID=UPI000D3D6071|nr:AAA family ATPase [Neisseria elongata]
MKLHSIKITNFQSFGEEPTEFTLEEITYLIGPNGSGKTAVLQALCRLFAFDSSLRRVKRTDFHIPQNESSPPDQRTLSIEADFIFPETAYDDDNSTVAPFFNHMRLDGLTGLPRVRFRLTATMDFIGEIEEKFEYVLTQDGKITQSVSRADRSLIQLHYLPAQRNPSDHIAYNTNALLGRLLRAVNWENESESVRTLTEQINSCLENNTSVQAISDALKKTWEIVHKGSYFKEPKISFAHSEIENILRHMSVSFTPGHDEEIVDFSRLSDGQKSMLYLSLVLTSQSIYHSVRNSEDNSFDIEKLRPPIFTLIALEEPENSLSPHYLGRVIEALKQTTQHNDAQAIIATHAPAMLRRVSPEHIRYLRLNGLRTTMIRMICLPDKSDDAHKFVREAIQAFPEIYFSRLVVLGEGDSEEIVLPRILSAKGIPVDSSAITIAPLGGRHVNHFWRLLSQLEIPYITLLDLDMARFGGGWGRIKYANDQLKKFEPEKILPDNYVIPEWNSSEYFILKYEHYLDELEKKDIFYSRPMDLDFSMLKAFPNKFKVENNDTLPSQSLVESVLGGSHHNPEQYTEEERKLFSSYHKLFKLGSKPVNHIQALANLTDEELLNSMPESLSRLAVAVKTKLLGIPE